MNYNDPATHLYHGFRHLVHTFQELSQNPGLPEMVRHNYQTAAASMAPFLTGYEMTLQDHTLKGTGPRMTALRDAAQWLGVELSDEKKKAMQVKTVFASEQMLEGYDTDRAVDRWTQMFMHPLRIGEFTPEELEGRGTRYVRTAEWDELDGLSFKLKYVASYKQDPDDPFDPDQKVYLDHIEVIYGTVHKYWVVGFTVYRQAALFNVPLVNAVATNLVENLAQCVVLAPEQAAWFLDWIVAEHGLRTFNIPLTTTVLDKDVRPLDVMAHITDFLQDHVDDADKIIDRIISRCSKTGHAKGLFIPFGPDDLTLHLTVGRSEWWSVGRYREEVEKYQHMRSIPLIGVEAIIAAGVDVKGRMRPYQWGPMMETALTNALQEIADEYYKSKKK